ncbi:MAG: hypothetical protein VX820_04960 [Candidatus Neomarinimicrobiota bacterium]|nr:hypothetical protein [Candidatus Neomarinimicrobiota bacterium]
MFKAMLLAFRIMFFSFLLPYNIWNFSKEKILKIGNNSISNMLDEEYVMTSWMDLFFDAIIFLLYPFGFFFTIMAFFLSKSFFILLILIPIYLFPLFLSFLRELGGSFMLLHMNVKKIRRNLDDK